MEEMAVFKSFLRSQLRLLRELQQAIKEKNFERAEELIDQLVEDTKNGIED